MKSLIAARVAADLSAEIGIDVKTVRGGLGELSVQIDGASVVETSRLLYAMPAASVRQVRDRLSRSKTDDG